MQVEQTLSLQGKVPNASVKQAVVDEKVPQAQELVKKQEEVVVKGDEFLQLNKATQKEVSSPGIVSDIPSSKEATEEIKISKEAPQEVPVVKEEAVEEAQAADEVVIEDSVTNFVVEETPKAQVVSKLDVEASEADTVDHIAPVFEEEQVQDAPTAILVHEVQVSEENQVEEVAAAQEDLVQEAPIASEEQFQEAQAPIQEVQVNLATEEPQVVDCIQLTTQEVAPVEQQQQLKEVQVFQEEEATEKETIQQPGKVEDEQIASPIVAVEAKEVKTSRNKSATPAVKKSGKKSNEKSKEVKKESKATGRKKTTVAKDNSLKMTSTMKIDTKKAGLKKTMKKSNNKLKEEKTEALAPTELVKEAKDGTTKGDTQQQKDIKSAEKPQEKNEEVTQIADAQTSENEYTILLKQYENQTNEVVGLKAQIEEQGKKILELENSKVAPTDNGSSEVAQQINGRMKEIMSKIKEKAFRFEAGDSVEVCFKNLNKMDGYIDKLNESSYKIKVSAMQGCVEKSLFQKQLQLSQEKIAELMSLLEQSRSQFAVYIPKKSDSIDCALAGFVNKYPEKENMKIMFLRESEGVYRFGSRRIQIKIERGNTVMVRVGGGYMDVKDFLEKFQNFEANKISRRDVIKRFQNKSQLQRLARDRSTSISMRNTVSLNDMSRTSGTPDFRNKKSISPTKKKNSKSISVPPKAQNDDAEIVNL